MQHICCMVLGSSVPYRPPQNQHHGSKNAAQLLTENRHRLLSLIATLAKQFSYGCFEILGHYRHSSVSAFHIVLQVKTIIDMLH